MYYRYHTVLFVLLLFFTPALTVGQGPGIPSVILTNVEMVSLDEDSVAVTWVTNRPSDTAIQWGTTDQLGQEMIIEESELYHIAFIDGLDEGNEYFYRVGSDGRWTPLNNFTTLSPPSGTVNLQFVIAGDPHVDMDGRNGLSGNMLEDSPRLLESLVHELNDNSNISFLLMTGDLTNGEMEDFERFSDIMKGLVIPWYPVLGNWDKNNAAWEEWVPNATGRSDHYYSFDVANFHFIVLDSAVEGQVSGNISEEQFVWLENDLEANRDPPTLIFMHHMADRADEIFGIESMTQERLLAILSVNPQVLSVTSGHIHQNLRSEIGHVPNIATASVVQYPIGYSVVKLYDDAYSQSFRKVGEELAVSEESRVRLNTNSGSTSADEEYLGELDERSFVVEPPDNVPPVISSIAVDPEKAAPSETVSVEVVAADPDGDELTYDYTVTGGTIQGSGAFVSWMTPDTEGGYTVSVTVFDGTHMAGPASADLVVEASPIQENDPPVIRDIQVWEAKIAPGETTKITTDAYDPDGDTLTYHYEPTGGVVLGSGNDVVWQAPGLPGVYDISVWVSDSIVSSEKENVKITVEEAPGDDDTTDDDDSPDNDDEDKGRKDESPGFELGYAIIAIFLLTGCFKMNKHPK